MSSSLPGLQLCKSMMGRIVPPEHLRASLDTTSATDSDAMKVGSVLIILVVSNIFLGFSGALPFSVGDRLMFTRYPVLPRRHFDIKRYRSNT